ncbi:hypothetical protein ACPV5L_08260 [Vibrio astriarenae]
MSSASDKLITLSRLFDYALEQKDFNKVSELNRALKKWLQALNQRDPSLKVALKRLKQSHDRCMKAVESETKQLELSIKNNATLVTRDKAYKETQMRTKERLT